MTRRLLLLPAALVLIAASGAGAQGPGRFPAPDRPVAEIVSPIWASEEERDGAKETQQVFAAMGVKPGQTVADIGAGSGFYVVRLSPVVGPEGKVYAEDVEPSYIAGLKTRLDKLGLRNVVQVRGAVDDPALPKASLDAAFLIHMYHEIEQPYGLLWRLAGSMKPGGRIAIVDADRAPQNHGTPPRLLKCEVEAVGYKQVSVKTLDGGVGYLAIFAPPAPDKLPAPAAIKPCKG